MKIIWIATLYLAFCLPGYAQSASDPASREDILLLLRTMHSHDMLQKMMEVQAQTTQRLLRDTIAKEKGSVPPDFDVHFNKAIHDMIMGMPVDEVVQAMVPAYQAHFTHGDIDAMNAFYSSPVGQKVLQELPAVMQEGTQAVIPILTKYLGEWKDRMKQEFESTPKPGPAKQPVTIEN